MTFRRDIFVTGEYLRHFNPDDSKNPFAKIYEQKKLDAINLINKINDLKTILDVGGGMGRLSLSLTENPQHRVVLTDISIDMLTVARKNKNGRSLNPFLINADAHQLPFRDGYFGVVVALDLFCHLVNPKRALGEFHRILERRGMLIVDSTNSNPLWALFYPRYMGKNPLTWLKIFKSRGVYPGWESIVNHYPKRRFISFLQEAGFKVIQSLHYGPMVCPKWHLAVSKKIT